MAEDLKQIAESWAVAAAHGNFQAGKLARGYLSLLEENQRLREAVDRAAGMLENACKQSCEAWRPYGKHAPECHWDIAEELREALGKREGTGEAKNG